MPSTIGWLALAIAVGSLVGLMVGHWSLVAGWMHRCIEDPIGRRQSPERDASLEDRFGRWS